MLDKLRTEQTSTLPFNGMETQKSLLEATKEGGNETVPQAYAVEILSLKVGLRAEDNTFSFWCLNACSIVGVHCVAYVRRKRELIFVFNLVSYKKKLEYEYHFLGQENVFLQLTLWTDACRSSCLWHIDEYHASHGIS